MIEYIGKDTLKRSLIVGTVFLFLLTISLPAVNASEGKPDLIIEQIGFSLHGGWQDIACFSIKNIGDTKTPDEISYKYTFTQMLFGIIPIRIVRTDTLTLSHDGGLEPQETCFGTLIYENELPKFGFFEFKCTVNPGKIIEESNYDNNDLSQKYVAILGQWIEIG